MMGVSFSLMNMGRDVRKSGPEVIKLFTYSNHLSMRFVLLTNVKMPIIVGILTFISMIKTFSYSTQLSMRFINITSERLKARNFFICWYLSL